MSTFICLGYEGYSCGKTVERTGQYHKVCHECSQKREKASKDAYRAAHKEEIKARVAAYEAAHREEISVRNHHHWIFGTKKTSPRNNYEGVPFEDTWNPEKGGSFRAGGNWIIANLGKRPEGCSLHIIPNGKGFVPGNLVWTYLKGQTADQMFKIIARQKHQIQQQSEYIQTLEKRISELLSGRSEEAA
jgi:hypothetical protein